MQNRNNRMWLTTPNYVGLLNDYRTDFFNGKRINDTEKGQHRWVFVDYPHEPKSISKNDYERRVMATRCTPTELLLAIPVYRRPFFWFEQNGKARHTNVLPYGTVVEFKTAYSAMAAFEPTPEENERAAEFFGLT